MYLAGFEFTQPEVTGGREKPHMESKVDASVRILNFWLVADTALIPVGS